MTGPLPLPPSVSAAPAVSAPQAGAAPGTAQARSKDTPAKILDAARQFEALLIGQLMRGAQDEDGDGLGGEDGSSGAMMDDIGQQQFARALSQNGGLGLAKMIAESLTPRS